VKNNTYLCDMKLLYKKLATSARRRGGRAPSVNKAMIPHYFTKDDLMEALRDSRNYIEAAEYLGIATGRAKAPVASLRHLQQIAEYHSVNLDDYLIKNGSRTEKLGNPKITEGQMVREILIIGEKRHHGTHLKGWLYKFGFKKPFCEECNIGVVWNEKPLTLQLHHINGNPKDNRLENLQILCPNCHTQTETYGFKNRIK